MSNFTYPVNTNDVLKVDYGPEVVFSDEDNVLKRKLVIGRKGWFLDEVWVFHGRDQGNHAEMDTEIYDGLRPLYLSSEHDMLHYEAQTHHGVYRRIEYGITIAIGMRAGFDVRRNHHTVITVRPHWGIYFNWDKEVTRED